MFIKLLSPDIHLVYSWHSCTILTSVVSLCLSRFCSKRVDMPLLRSVPDADAGDHVDVFSAMRDWSSDCGLLCRVRWSCQTQRRLLRRLQTCNSASFCKRRRCSQETVGSQWEACETALMFEAGRLRKALFMFFFTFVLFLDVKRKKGESFFFCITYRLKIKNGFAIHCESYTDV